MLRIALLSALAYFICYAGNWISGQSMTDRPIVIGAVAGLLLGDLRQGLIIGATLEAVFMGSVNIGGQISADHTAATVFAVAFATNATLDPKAALTIAVPLGILMGFVTMGINNVLLTVFVPLMDKWAYEGNERGLLLYLNFGVWFVKNVFFASVVFFGVYIGFNAVSALVKSIPPVVMTGLTVCGQLLPAVGLALLMKMIWTKQIGMYYLLGFVLFIYLKLPIIAIAVLGIILIASIAFREIDANKLQKQHMTVGSVNNNEDELEGFLQ
jgi:mannose PTS system EIIC component